MKKLIALLFVLCMCPVVAGAESKGVNLVEFARRYYYAMDFAGLDTAETRMGEGDEIVVIIDDFMNVRFDEELNVQGITLVIGANDEHDMLRLVCAATALSVSSEEIDISEYEGMADKLVLSVTDDTVRFGDYAITMWFQHEEDILVKFELD